MATSLPTPNLIAKPFANDGTKNTIPTAATGTNAASLSEGFPLLTATLPENGGLPPKRADVNGMGYLATQPLYALQNGYLETFRADVSTAIGGYPAGARLWYQDSNGGLMLVKSLINNNTYNFNTNPAYIDGQKWTVDVQSIPSVAGQSGKFLSNNGTSAFWSKGVVGMVSPYAGTTAPDGWLICDGSAISRTTYSDLFSVIGTIYGSGDGSTTFLLPNFNDRVIQGKGTRGGLGSYLGESLPNITGKFGGTGVDAQLYNDPAYRTGEGATLFDKNGGKVWYYNNERYAVGDWSFNASRCSSAYKNNAPVQQNALCVNMVIKY